VALGLGLALVITTVGRDGIGNMLFGVHANDPLTYLAVCGLVSAISLLAVYVPAKRATRVQPVIALRAE